LVIGTFFDMSSIYDADESRRRFLLYLLSTGALSTITACGSSGQAASAMPEELSAGRSIFKFSGDVRVNGQQVTLETLIRAGDVIETFDKSFIIFVLNKDSFILRSNSKMSLPVAVAAVVPTVLSLDRGKVLTVLASRTTRIKTPSAIIGIRGTGVYLEAEPELSYVCTCYGLADLATTDDPDINETILSEHHTSPRYILADKSSAKRIQPAPFKNHDDQELLLIETLVGRTTPYVVPKGITRTRSRYF